jgi:hypothetical protein
MLDDAMILTGRWHKSSSPPCATAYPDDIEFGDARYRARKGPDQGFVVWDVGSVEVLDEQTVRLGIATDQRVEYRFGLDGDTLTLTDPEGCTVGYRREP